ncbi:MAG: hypothetical protein KAQ90_02965 [Melioribacteraceae bacterium]|nr:hypothetical protein [Melioribacteraceae bacterium]
MDGFIEQEKWIRIDSTTITMEANVLQGTKFYLVGLPDNAVKESEQPAES